MTTVENIPGAASGSARCTQTALHAAIANHFAGRASVKGEAALRAHLLGCRDCDERYRRHLLLARFDPRALPACDRLGRGLGFRGEGRTGPWLRGWVWGLCVPAAAILLLVLLPRHLLRGDARSGNATGAASEFAARGRTGAPPSFWTYRLGNDGTPRLAEQAIGRSDEMAFAYSNVGAKPFLMIFGVDEHRHVYWFHPGWPPGTPAPQALSAKAGLGPLELSEAIRQPFDGGRLRIFAAFGDRPFDATMVEEAVQGAPDGDPSRLLTASGVTVVDRAFEVDP